MLPALTPRQKAIYDFILKTVREKGYPPTLEEIGTGFRIASKNGVADHLKALARKGYIRRAGRRAIEILSPLGKPVTTAFREVPIVGRIAAGRPVLAEENFEGWLSLPNELAPGKESFILKVKGDSMMDAGILDGDLVVVHRQDTAQNGDIVCALINGEATLKKYLKKGDTITLKAENKNYPPIRVSGGEFRILGKLGTLIRKF